MRNTPNLPTALQGAKLQDALAQFLAHVESKAGPKRFSASPPTNFATLQADDEADEAFEQIVARVHLRGGWRTSDDRLDEHRDDERRERDHEARVEAGDAERDQ